MQFFALERGEKDFQQPVTAAQVEAMCQRAFGTAAAVVSARELPSGMFNTTFVVELPEQKVILRIGPHPAAEVFANEVNLLRREYTLQPYLGAISDIAPRTLFADFSRELLNRDYVFQQFLPGDLWDEVKDELTAEAADSLWEQLAQISKRIHATTGEHFGFPHPQSQFTRWSDFIIDIVAQMRDDLVHFGLSTEGVAPYLEALHNGRAILDEITTPHLLHGDLWPKNVLIDRTSPARPQIVGLLDSERGVWGDPLAEWIFYFLEMPDAYWQAYGRPAEDAGTQFRMAAYHGLYCVQLLLEAYRFAWDAEQFRSKLVELTAHMKQLGR